MEDLYTIGILYFVSFFTILNPLGILPVFLSMTASLDDKQRRNTAIKAVITAFFVLVIFAFGGQLIFQFFNISVNGFRIVGGVLFFVIGYDMLNARISRIKIDPKTVKEYVDDISITPLGIPMLAGPAAITNSIVLMEDSPDVQTKSVLIIVIFVTCLINLIILVGASRIVNLIGDIGIKIMMKLMGLIVMVIAVEFFISGFTPIIQNMLGIA